MAKITVHDLPRIVEELSYQGEIQAHIVPHFGDAFWCCHRSQAKDNWIARQHAHEEETANDYCNQLDYAD